jgi:hypothetical protein
VGMSLKEMVAGDPQHPGFDAGLSHAGRDL